MHVTQAISFTRLVVLPDEVFGVDIGEGAIANSWPVPRRRWWMRPQ